MRTCRRQRSSSSGGKLPGQEALGQIGIAAGRLKHELGLTRGETNEGAWPERIEVAELVKLAASAVNGALGDLRQARRRPPHPTSAAVIQDIVDRLAVPTDERSRKAAAAILSNPRVAAARDTPSLRGVADIVFQAIGAAWLQHNGRPVVEPPDAGSSMKAYIAGLPASRRPSRGRPKNRT